MLTMKAPVTLLKVNHFGWYSLSAILGKKVGHAKYDWKPI